MSGLPGEGRLAACMMWTWKSPEPTTICLTPGGVAEWSNAPVLKTGNGASRSGVRIPSPPLAKFRPQRPARAGVSRQLHAFAEPRAFRAHNGQSGPGSGRGAALIVGVKPAASHGPLYHLRARSRVDFIAGCSRITCARLFLGRAPGAPFPRASRGSGGLRSPAPPRGCFRASSGGRGRWR